LGYQTLSKMHPGVIVTSITPFGQTGPYSRYKAPDIVSCSMGGQAYLTGDIERPPCRVSFPQAYLLSSIHAVMGTLIALRHRGLSGEGQHVDVSIQEAVVWTLQGTVQYWDLMKYNTVRAGLSRSYFIGPRYPTRVMRFGYPCKDGYVAFMVGGGLLAAISMPAMVKWMAEEEMLGAFEPMKDWGYDEWLVRDVISMSREETDAEEDTLARFFATKTKAELYEEALKRRIILYPSNTARELADDMQLREREFYVNIEHPELSETVTYVGAPYKMTETVWRIWRRAPLIGEHNVEIYRGELGFTRDEMRLLSESSVI